MKKKKRIIVSVTNDLYTDQRVKKVCSFLVSKNYEVTLCGRQLKSSLALEDRGYKCVRFKLPFTKGVLFYASFNIRLFFYLIFHKADFLLANDLDTLLANHMAKKLKSNCQLVYDSHEYFIGVPELVNKPMVKKIWRSIERRTLPKADHMYTVNSSIAELYKQEYDREIKVVRNISDPKAFSKKFTKAELGLPENKKIIIIQGAGINVDRGAEEAIEAIKLIENTLLIFVGNGDVIPILKAQVKAEKLDEKVLFFGKRSYNELMNFTLLSDLGLSLDKSSNINYQFSLPNKIFDYIHAGIPLLVTDLIEVKKIVLGYSVGLVTPSLDPTVLADKIKEILFNKQLNSSFRQNSKIASSQLSWSNEIKILDEIYE